MAAQKRDLKRHQILLFDGDYAAIQSVYGPNAAAIIRELVRKFVREHIEKD